MQKIEILKTCLYKIINNLDCGNSNLNEEECTEIINTINRLTDTETKYSKYQACEYLHISRATFDNWVKDGKLPLGKKQQGFKEKFWLKKDLDKIKYSN